ncbi:TPR repeat-containing protein DDB_G0287407-like [Physella acuta]|uniref:TPR repeat-containing protein DDB_G0287407-like n=1 Tax=Physella acuta TaxID=109671 RepID=UPI0027DE392E|nr:TPR repeat-containing protein DDB_G0287407-like [Physella acuta]
MSRKLKDPRTLRLFFSSPFGGMEEEREELTRKYFPQFHHLCKARGIQFVAVDMRWGITSEAADNAQVINICLREIDRSDVFIGFFGQRYGWHGESDELLQRNFDNAVGRYSWLDSVRNKSVTELEFLHGHLNKPGELPAAFCFRSKVYDDFKRKECLEMGDNKNSSKFTAESEHSTALLSDLIRRVKDSESHCLGVLLDYANPVEGAKFMFESVWEHCKELISESENVALSPLDHIRLSHDTFMAFCTSLYIGGKTYLNELVPSKLKAHPKVLVKGPAGCGKSALLANLVKELKVTDFSLQIIYHFVGCAQETTDPKSILNHILLELQFINGKIEEEKMHESGSASKSSTNAYDIYLSVQKEMGYASSDGKNVLIVIDGLDKVKASSKTEKHLFWLPEKCPSGIFLVVSTKSSDKNTIELLVEKQQFYELEILPLEREVQEKISKETLMINGKELSTQQLQRVVEAEQTKNPLFLKIVLSEISIYGYFRLLDKKIDSLIFSNGVTDVLSKVLQRMEEDYNVKTPPTPVVQQVLSALAVSHNGLTETEILEMFNLTSHVWSPFYFTIENFLIIHNGLLRFAFTELHQAVTERYLDTEDKRSASAHHLIKYFERLRQENRITSGIISSPSVKRIATELPFLQLEVRDTDGLVQTLSDINIFHELASTHAYELISLWESTGYDQYKICETLIYSVDQAITEIYTYQMEHQVTNPEPPGYILYPVLKSMKDMFSLASHYRAQVKILQRTIQILEGIKTKIPEDVRLTLLRDSQYYLACAYVDNTEYDKAQSLHEAVMTECRRLLQETDDKRIKQTLAYSCNGLGVLHLRQKHYKEAEPLFLESVSLHKELGNLQCVAEATQNIGVIKLENDEPEVALQYFNEAMQTFEELYFGYLPLVVGNLLTNMAICWRKMNNVEEAEKMYLRSLKVKANAVGWNHEVIATCYMNLGSLEFYRKNFIEAEDYTRKAIKILEFNEVKLEQNEMWQAQENLVLNLISMNKWEEALPIFLNVFAMLQRTNQVDQGAATVHREMIKYLTHIEMFEEAAEVAISHINSPKLRLPNTFILLDYCDKKAAAALKNPPERPKEQTVEYALHNIWPGNNELTAYFVQNYVLPSNDYNRLKELVRTMDKNNPDFNWTSYKVGAEWCELKDNMEAAISILQDGLEMYPNSIELKTKIFDCYRLMKRHTEAYPYLKEVLANEPENQSLMLVAGDVALKSDDLDLCMELWEKVSHMSDENLANKAKNALQSLRKLLNAEQETNSVDQHVE